jgi:type IV pilus assembly protein PilC
MKLDEFGALRQLSAGLAHGDLKAELSALEADLAKGTPLRDALPPRQLPEFYKRMLLIGAQANDLPGVLLMLADHYARLDALWARLKGLMVYPFLLLLTAAAVSGILAFVLDQIIRGNELENLMWFGGLGERQPNPAANWLFLRWFPVVVLGMSAFVLFVALVLPNLRQSLRWRVPAFRDASLAQLAGSLSLLLKHGCSLREALGFLRQSEGTTPLGCELDRWQAKLASGEGKLSEITAGSSLVPPMFVWLAEQDSDNLSRGFERVSELFLNRSHRSRDQLVHAALPTAIVALGFIIICQVVPVFRTLQYWMDGPW